LGGCPQPTDDGETTPTAYAIAYELNGGTNAAANPVTYTGKELPLALAAPTREGHTFGGWYEDAAFSGNPVDRIPAGSTGDKAFHAKWTPVGPETHTITYILNGGTNAGANPASYTNAELPITLAAPTREGYTFEGWYADSGFTGTALTSIPADSTGNKTFHAKWTPVAGPGTYTIVYTLNGGTNAGANPSAYTGADLPITLAAPAREGYSFGGWYADSDFSGSVVAEIPADSTGNKTFYARWSPAEYAITYELNGGTNTEANPATYTIESPSITLAAAPARTGYSFGGWYADSGFTGSKVALIPGGSTGDKAFYAKWTAVTYNISYRLNNGTFAGPYPPMTFTIENPAITLAVPARTHYTFEGWYADSDFTGSAVAEIPAGSTGNKIFHARWNPVEYAITYELDGGTNAETNPAIYTVESAAIALADPSRAGYTFLGWYANNGFTGNAVTRIPADSTGNRTFYARWSDHITYTITYELNYGTNAGTNPTTYTVESATISLADPSRAGYVFGGWYADSGFSGSAVTEIPAGSTGDKTFYAKWLPTGSARITLTIDDFASSPASDRAGGAFPNDPINLSKSGAQSTTITVETGATDVTWYVGLAKMETGNSFTLNAAMLSVGKHILRVTAKYDGELYSKELPFTVTE
jgi:uncharacterized repeat protein (TIGR02543 family)